MTQPSSVQPGSDQVVRLAQADLAERLNLSPDQIHLLSCEAVDWPDSSLGRPRPGMMYLQVITPGYRIELQALDRHHLYHAGAGHVVYTGEL